MYIEEMKNIIKKALQAMTFINSHNATGDVTNDYMTGAKYEMSNLTYDLLVQMMHEETVSNFEAAY